MAPLFSNYSIRFLMSLVLYIVKNRLDIGLLDQHNGRILFDHYNNCNAIQRKEINKRYL
jgi:hypothetical protein